MSGTGDTVMSQIDNNLCSHRLKFWRGRETINKKNRKYTYAVLESVKCQGEKGKQERGYEMLDTE